MTGISSGLIDIIRWTVGWHKGYSETGLCFQFLDGRGIPNAFTTYLFEGGLCSGVGGVVKLVIDRIIESVCQQVLCEHLQ